MQVRDRHDHYLRGFMSSLQMERYENLVSSRPALAAELQARLTSDVEWDPEMVPRARALLTVCEAYFELTRPEARDAASVQTRLNLLPPAMPFALAPYETGLKKAPAPAPAPTVDELVDSVIVSAINGDADQVEIVPGQGEVRIYFDTGSPDRAMMAAPRELHESLVLRLKVMANLDPAPSTVPQHGRIPTEHEGRKYQLWVRFEPTSAGEIITLTFVPAA